MADNEYESTETQCLRFLSNPLNFANSQATMSNLLGPDVILCLVTLPTKGDDGLYKGKQIPRLDRDHEKIEKYNIDMRETSVSYRSKTTLKVKTTMPLDTIGPFDYHPPMVYYSFYALDPNNNENGYELIGYGIERGNIFNVKPICLPFPEKMNDEPYNPEQFPECENYPKNKNPTLVEFSEFLVKNPNVQFFTLKYDDSPEMQEIRRQKKYRIEEEARILSWYREQGENSRNNPELHNRYFNVDHGGGGPSELFVVPTMNSSNMVSPSFWHNGLHDIIDSKYVLDKSGMVFVEKIKEFWDFFTSRDYSSLIQKNRDKIVNDMLQNYIEFARIWLPDNPHDRPDWMRSLSRNNVRKYLDGDIKLSPIHFLNRKTLEDYKKTIHESRVKLLSEEQITKITLEFEKKAELQIPYGLRQQNTGLQRFIEQVVLSKHHLEDAWSHYKLNPNFCLLYFSKEFAETLSRAIPGFPIKGFEIFRESNSNSNETNLLKLFKIIIDSIQTPLVTDGGNIKKLYIRKNRKPYSIKNRKPYSRKNRKSYSRKNRKSYIRKNRKLYSRKNI
jgi:hypothetical protein